MGFLSAEAWSKYAEKVTYFRLTLVLALDSVWSGSADMFASWKNGMKQLCRSELRKDLQEAF